MKTNDKRYRCRIIAFLTKEEMEFVERLGLDALFSTGHKLSRIDIISSLVDAAMELDISAKGVHAKEELVEKVLDSAMNTNIERRRYPRINRNLILRFRKMDSLEEYEKSETSNIGMGGFMMETFNYDYLPQINELLEITLKDPKEESPINAMGKVSWIRKKESHDGLDIGVMLTYIREEDKERFLKCLSNKVRTKIKEEK